MSEQELREKATISCPWKLPDEKIQDLLMHWMKTIPSRINYNFSGFGNLEYGRDGLSTDEHYLTQVAGMITDLRDTRRDTHGFELIRDQTGDLRGGFNGARVCTPPGYEMEDVSERELSFMDFLRTKTGEYFEQSGE